MDEPVRCKLYPLPYSMKEEPKKDIDMIRMRVIRDSLSPYASPFVIVKSKTKQTGFVLTTVSSARPRANA